MNLVYPLASFLRNPPSKTLLLAVAALPFFLAESFCLAASCAPPPSGLVGWWRGEGTAADSSGTNNGSLIGGVGFAPGMVGQGFLLNGFDSYIRVPNSPSLDFTNALTVEFWFKNLRTDSYVYGLIANRGAETAPVPFGINVTPWGLQVYFKDPWASSSYETTPYMPVPAPLTWHHLAATYQQNSTNSIIVSAYLDGALIQSGSWPGNLGNTINTNPITIGISTEYPSYEYFNGIIDEVSLYNRALAAIEVQSIYDAGAAGKCGNPTPPIIFAQPGDQTVFAGQSASFSVAAGGSAPLSYQWLFNTAPILGETNSMLLITNVQSGQGGLYAVRIANSLGSITSSNATLLVNSPPPCSAPADGLVSWWRGEGDALDFLGGNNGTVLTGTSFAPGEVGQSFSFDGTSSAVVVPAASNLNVQSFTIEAWLLPTDLSIPRPIVEYGATNGTVSPLHFWTTWTGSAGVPGALYGIVRDPSGAYVQVGTQTGVVSSNIWNHVAFTYDATSLRAFLYVNGFIVASNNSAVALHPSTYVPVNLGYRPVGSGDVWGGRRLQGKLDEVSIYNRALGQPEIQAIYNASFSGKCTTPVPPTLFSQPISQTVTVGKPVSFAVTAGGTPPLSYQWRLGGNPLPGATAASLVLTNVQLTQAGVYSVRVTNSVGSIVSSNALLAVNQMPPCGTAPTNLVSWWQGEGDAADSFGTNSGTMVNGVRCAPGQVGQAFSFNGINQFVRVADDPSLDPTNAMSLECWVYINSVPSGNLVVIASKEDPASIHQYQLTLYNNLGQLFFRPLLTVAGSFVYFSGNTLVQVGQWYHVAMTYDGSFLKLYVNGNLDGSAAATGPIATSTQPFRIGGDETGWFFNGLVDELAFYSRALTDAEVQAIYNSAGSGKCPIPIAPVFSVQPLDQNLTVGQVALFNAEVDGSRPMSYQWTFNGANIVGATGATLTLTNVQVSQSGSYMLQATNTVGFAVSRGAMLTVNLPPANVRVVNTLATGGQVVTVPIVIAANGNENALGFSLSFIPSRLTFTNAVRGAGANGAAFVVNTNSAGSGALGIAIALPIGATFSPGTQEVAEVSFIAAGLPSPTSTTVLFTDSPTYRQLSDTQALPLAATYSSGTVTIPAANFEADVSPRPAGDKAVTITDWVQVGRYAARLDYPTNASEYQRADCAPRNTLGDGAISVADWVQAGRYAAGLDPRTVAGGPTNDATANAPSLSKLNPHPEGLNPRQVRVGTAYLVQNRSGTVSVYLDAQGNENAVGFSLSFDPTILHYSTASLGVGASAATIDVNASQVGSGRLAFVLAMPIGQAFTAGTKELVTVTFSVATPVFGSYPVAMTDQPVLRQVVDPQATPLAAAYVSGSVIVNPPPALGIALSAQSVTLAWPLWATNFVLQEADGATMPSPNWTNLNQTFIVSTNSAQVTIPLGGATKLYRLKN